MQCVYHHWLPSAVFFSARKSSTVHDVQVLEYEEYFIYKKHRPTQQADCDSWRNSAICIEHLLGNLLQNISYTTYTVLKDLHQRSTFD